jgi:hypothetical protein
LTLLCPTPSARGVFWLMPPDPTASSLERSGERAGGRQ